MAESYLLDVSLITVFNENNAPSMKLQARSLAQFTKPDELTSILVVTNGLRSKELKAWAQEELLELYEDLGVHVRIVDGNDLSPNICAAHGWWSQQALKFLAARQSERKYSVILDSKDHLIKKLEAGTIFGPSGKPRSYWADNSHSLREHFDRSYRYFGIDPESYSTRSLPQITPFIVRNDLVSRLIATVEQKEQRSYGEAFLALRLTEFFSYAAFILTNGIEFNTEYDFGEKIGITIFRNRVENAVYFADDVSRARRSEASFFAIHHLAKQVCSDDQAQQIMQLWTELKLVQSEAEAREIWASNL